MTSAAQHTDRALRQADRSPVARFAARSGFVASGIVQVLVGVLAIRVALPGGSREPDQSGALQTLASAPGGAVLVWIAALGALALTAWLLLDGLLERRRPPKERWKRRASSWGRAVVYGAIGVTALRVALGAHSSSAGSSRRGSATVLALPGGPVLLALAGAGIVVGGVALVVVRVSGRFVRAIRVPEGAWGRVVVGLGRVGGTARGIAVAMAGVLIAVAGFTTDAKKGSGLDGALRTFAQLPFGTVLLLLIGAGWIVGGLYAFTVARLAKLD